MKKHPHPEWGDPVTTRLLVALFHHGLDTKEKAAHALKSGTLAPGRSRYYGKVLDAELRTLLNMPIPGKDLCPCCGQTIKRPRKN